MFREYIRKGRKLKLNNTNISERAISIKIQDLLPLAILGKGGSG